jgi:hypothetical protein
VRYAQPEGVKSLFANLVTALFGFPFAFQPYNNRRLVVLTRDVVHILES